MHQQLWQNARTRRLARHRNMNSSSATTYHLPALLIVLLVLIQNFDLHMCRQLMRQPNDKRSKESMKMRMMLASSPTTLKDTSTPEEMLEQDKRGKSSTSESAATAASSSSMRASQPEEIFSMPNDDTDNNSNNNNNNNNNYDEYPLKFQCYFLKLQMVVPKRAALLLDRLMVALHHALEHEHNGHRIGEFYANKNNLNSKLLEYQNGLDQRLTGDEGNNLNMYSDDDPGVMLDYDFKDLNQINRATGETLMPKSFQRRAGAELTMAGSGPSASSSSASSSSLSSSAASVSALPASSRRLHGGSGSGSGGGRMYWRCYFNAVSCF
ncbi:probable basic-leucine zipper transcription factor L [Drosophila willistoni]|uniref:probable basic-leucine zipper transcription factor L n=1 Tax=Drosophila willistoni TaxID=7260 RepID=UPI001F077F2E|nr:probable basic-leucine zipper transcription factor L [Drosophila willistoni]